MPVKGIGFIINLVWTGAGEGRGCSEKSPTPSYCVTSSLLLELVQVGRRKSQSEKRQEQEALPSVWKSGPKSYPALTECTLLYSGWSWLSACNFN